MICGSWGRDLASVTSIKTAARVDDARRYENENFLFWNLVFVFLKMVSLVL